MTITLGPTGTTALAGTTALTGTVTAPVAPPAPAREAPTGVAAPRTPALDVPSVAARRWGSRRTRILVVHSSDELYGSDRIVSELVEELAGRDDLDVTVWLPSDVERGALGPLLREHGARVERIPLPILRRNNLNARGLLAVARDAARTRARLVAGRFDLVWLATSACLVVAPLARSAGVPSIVGHLQEPWEGGDRRLSVLARSCTSVVAVSRSVLDSTGLSTDARSTVVHNGVPLGDPTPATSTAERLPRYVVASRWNPHKGHATLLTAWNAAGCPGELVVLGGPPAAGTGVDVPGLVEAVVSRPGTVTVVGEVDDATEWIRAADCVLLPTDALEGFGLVALEAFSEGRPVVASRSGGPEEVVEEGRTGWLFDRADVDGLADLFRALDVPTLAAAGERAAEVHRLRFTPERMRSRFVDVVERELGHALAPVTVVSHA